MKATSGGRFNPAEEYVYFLATAPGRHNVAVDGLPGQGVQVYPHVLVAVNELHSVVDYDKVDRLVDQGRQLLIDSGVFNLAAVHARTHGISHNEALGLAPHEVDGFEALFEKYCLIADRYRDSMWGMIEIDQGGLEYKPGTRARIEAEAGIVPIPVWHPLLDGIEYYRGLVAEYDRLCVGNLVRADPSTRVRMLTAVSELTRGTSTWHHLLGVTPSELTFALPVRGSSDSSTWLNGCRWPQSWGSKVMGKRAGLFGPDYSYSSDPGGGYDRTDALSLNESIAIQENVRDAHLRRSTW